MVIGVCVGGMGAGGSGVAVTTMVIGADAGGRGVDVGTTLVWLEQPITSAIRTGRTKVYLNNAKPPRGQVANRQIRFLTVRPLRGRVHPVLLTVITKGSFKESYLAD